MASIVGSPDVSGGEETELKLQLDLADIATLLADPVFIDHDPVSRDQISTYFDTEDRALQAAGLSLRIRRVAGRRVQTIKTESEAAASLFARGEWEREVHSDAPDLEDAPSLLTAALGKHKLRHLGPIFTVEVNRTSAIHFDGTNRIELVADQGRIVVGDRTCPIVEIELELLDGDRAALFDLARSLTRLVPMRPGVQSKSERGYALLAGKQGLSAKTEVIPLSRGIDAATLFEAVAGACIRQFRLNEDKFLASGAPVSLHQARVGLRRLRSALATFEEMIGGPELDRFQAGFRALASQLGRVRDVDVMIAKIDHEPALERLRAARAQRYQAAVETLNSDSVRGLVLDFVAWLSIGEWREREDNSELRDTPALVTAARMLDRLRRRIKRRGDHLATLGEHDRHKVRIAGKKLRYTAEFFSDLYPGKKASHRRKTFLKAIEDLQTALGHLNDLASGRALFDELGIADADTILATGRKADSKRLLADAEKAYRDLIEGKRFWR
jgi:inorganic triphosphatase YgiF